MERARDPGSRPPRGRSALARVVRAAVALVSAAVLLVWGWAALVLFVFRCGDNCVADGYDDWGYTGQAILAAVGVAAGFLAIEAGLHDGRRRLWIAGSVSIALAVVWWLCLTSGSL